MTAATEAPPAEAPRPSRIGAWRAHSFGPASEQPYRRRTSDWIRLVLGVGILVFAIWHQDDPGAFEQNLFTTLNGLPNQLESFFRLLYDARRALGRSGWSSWLRWWPAAGGSPATWPSVACSRGCSVGRSARSWSRTRA